MNQILKIPSPHPTLLDVYVLLAGSTGTWGLWSVHHRLFMLLLRERSPYPAPVLGLSGERQFSTNFSSMSPSLRLQFFLRFSCVGPFPQDAVLQKQPGPMWGNQRVTSPARKTALSWACHPMSPKFPVRSLLRHGLPKEVVMASRII